MLVLAACGTSVGSGERACTEIGTPVGIGLEIDKALAGKVTSATVKACWGGKCRETEVDLMPSSAPGQTSCDGEVCSAEVKPTGAKNGFADIQGLPATPVEVTLTLLGKGRTVLERTLDVTPRMLFPNGTECPGGGPQANLTVSGDGEVAERR